MRLRVDFSFFAVIALYLFMDESGFGLSVLSACVMHETAHFIAMAILKIPADSLTLYGAGMRITSSRLEYAKPISKAVILGAGCLANFTAAFCFWRAGERASCVINLFTGLFNLLPLGELDGAGLLKILVINRCKPENIDRIMLTASVLSVIPIAVSVYFAGGAAISLAATVLYIIFLSSGKI